MSATQLISQSFSRFVDRYPGRTWDDVCDFFFVFYALWTSFWITAYVLDFSLSEITPVFYSLLPLSLVIVALKPTNNNQTTAIVDPDIAQATLVVALFVLIAVVLTLFLHRPDDDDETFLAICVALLANNELPIREALSVFGDSTYAVVAYEPLKAMLAHSLGVPLLTAYYLIVPSIMSALTVIVSYRLLRDLVGSGWVFGMIFFFLVMLTWGDVHRTLANFGFVRMFQGKAALVSLAVPAIIFYFYRLRATASSSYNVVLLFAALISACGFSRGGFIIGPILVFLLALASIRLDSASRSLKRLALATAISALLVLPFLYIFPWAVNAPEGVHTAKGLVEATTNYEMLKFTFDDSFRGFFLLACVALGIFFLDRGAPRYAYRNYVLAFFLLLLIPGTSNFFAKIIHPFMSWRWMWIFPTPLLASVAVGGAVQRLRDKLSGSVALSAFLTVIIVFAAASPRWVISEKNRTDFRWPSAKIRGDTIYLRLQESTATINDGRLYLEGSKSGY